ncbi:MAG TPA: hypothetical protein VMU16_14650 [Candidatus Binataceae bacterium]|nr:hypothetical protein [Candidatus Binataceae bacterium]
MIRQYFRFVIALVIVSAIAGCSTINPPPTPQEKAEQMEPMLTAAGFTMLPADTPKKQQELSTTLPLNVQYYVGRTGKLHYWMADPYYCKCLYVGSEQAYQTYEQMSINQQLTQQEGEVAEEQLEARQQEEMAMQMEEFNPYGMGLIGPAIVW